MSKHRQHIENLLAMAVANHERDGYLAPTLIIDGPRDALLVGMEASPDLSPNFATAAGILLTTRRDTEVVVTIVEAWGRAFPEYQDEPEGLPPDFRHGDLGKMAEAGDPEVYTTLVVQAVDVKDPSQDLTATYNVDGKDAGHTAWMEGKVEGRMSEYMREAISRARTTIVPPNLDTNAALGVLLGSRVVAFAAEPLMWDEVG